MAPKTPEPKSRPAQLRKVVTRSLGGGVNLGVLASAVLGGAALHAWPLLALGAVAYGALVAWDVTNPDFIRKAIGVRPPGGPAELPDPATLRDAAARLALQGIVGARADLARVLVETPEEVKSHLGVMLSSIGDLEERAGRLALRADSLARYLADISIGQLQADVQRIDAQASRVTDPEARREYAAARASREERLRAVTDVASARDRIIARLESVAATLEALPAKVVRMRALDAQAMDALSGDIAEELSGFNRDIRSFEETLQSLAEVPETWPVH